MIVIIVLLVSFMLEPQVVYLRQSPQSANRKMKHHTGDLLAIQFASNFNLPGSTNLMISVNILLLLQPAFSAHRYKVCVF